MHSGQKLKVGARKTEISGKNYGNGLQPFNLNQLNKEVKDSGYCINTIPFPIVTASRDC